MARHGATMMKAKAVDVLWDSSAKGTLITLSNGNHDASSTTGGFTSVRAAIGKAAGSWYWELLVISAGTNGANNDVFALVMDATTAGGAGLDAFNPTNSGGTRGTGFVVANGFTVAGSGGFGTVSVGDTIGIAADATNKKMWIARNNAWVSSGNPAAGTNPYVTWSAAYTIYAATALADSGTTVRLKTATALYAPPSGFSVLA
jgi:hypothetical protein